MMRVAVKNIGWIVVLITLALLSRQALAQKQSQGNPPSEAEQDSSFAAPDLADVVPLEAQLFSRLMILQKKIEEEPDLTTIEKNYDTIESNLTDLAVQLERLEGSRGHSYSKLVELKDAVRRNDKRLEEISNPLNQFIRQLGGWRNEWLTERKRWNEWQASLLKDGELNQLKLVFQDANDTIDKALNLILPKLEMMLEVQKKGGKVQARIDAQAAEVDSLILEVRRRAFVRESPPMFSPQYFSQFRSSGFWYAVAEAPGENAWLDVRYLGRNGWILLLHGFLSCFVIIVAYRNRQLLSESKRWRFLAARPISAGLFLGAMVAMLIFEYEKAPAMFRLANAVVGWVSFARLSGHLLEAAWKRQFVYGLVTILILNRIMDLLRFPLPLSRLYTVLAAMGGLVFCLCWARKNIGQESSNLYTRLLRLGSLSFAVIVIAELWGKEAFASYLFTSLIRSLGIVLVFVLFMYIVRGGLEWLFQTSPLHLSTRLYVDNSQLIVRRMARGLDVIMWGLVLLPAILKIWGVYGNLEEATKGLLTFGFNLGSRRISVGLLIAVAAVLYGSFAASWFLERLLMDEVLLRRRVEKGVRLSIARLAHYGIIFVGFLFAISILGFDLTQLTIMLGALGVGIGFGLQGIVNNFISGLIILFERPVRVGDYIEFSGNWAEIRKIGLRATTVLTFDQADVIIPNADLITNQVINWTLSSRLVRIHIPVGVAYGSDVPLVMETLMKCASANPKVTKIPKPQVLFQSFGESSLDFELRVWVLDADEMLSVKSELHQEIDRCFRESGIEIAFPQRDLHVRSLTDSVISGSTQASSDTSR